MVAKTDKELGKLRPTLSSAEYTEVEGPRALSAGLKEAGKLYIVLTEENAKELYDIVIQYPTGQINYFDNEDRKMIWIEPAYVDSALIVLATVDTLLKIEKKGLSFRAVTGLAFQN